MVEDKRKISVGFIELEDYRFERDIIYVTLVPHGGGILAEASSREDFYVKGEKKKKVDNYVTHTIRDGIPLYTDHWDFVRMLEKENDAKIDDNRIETDGLKLVELLQETHYKTGIIKTF